MVSLVSILSRLFDTMLRYRILFFLQLYSDRLGSNRSTFTISNFPRKCECSSSFFQWKYLFWYILGVENKYVHKSETEKVTVDRNIGWRRMENIICTEKITAANQQVPSQLCAKKNGEHWIKRRKLHTSCRIAATYSWRVHTNEKCMRVIELGRWQAMLLASALTIETKWSMWRFIILRYYY